MSTVLGIGVGLFSLIIIWILCIFLCFILSRSGKQAGVFGVGVLLVLVTLVMALYPRKEENEVDTEQNNDYVDTMAIPRIIYAVFVTLFLLVGLVAFLLDHVLMPNIAVAAKTKKTYTF